MTWAIHVYAKNKILPREWSAVLEIDASGGNT